MSKRNLIANAVHSYRVWRSFRQYDGLFSLSDATAILSGVVLPGRFAHRRAGRALVKCAEIKAESAGVFKVTLPEHGIHFYKMGDVSNDLYWSIAQEFDPTFPHCYTTPPVDLRPGGLVLDVGACEGLFALRAIKKLGASRVICFEPSRRMAAYTRRAADENGVGNRITIVTSAVGNMTGTVFLEESANADGSCISAEGASGNGMEVPIVRIDDYCAEHGIKLSARDLIKVDAEGSDFDVLLGAERQIRDGSPQIAVTTYHRPEHASEMVRWLKKIQPAYRMRLKGFSSWTKVPTPVLLQAAL